jgi:hypothetical protein
MMAQVEMMGIYSGSRANRIFLVGGLRCGYKGKEIIKDHA